MYNNNRVARISIPNLVATMENQLLRLDASIEAEVAFLDTCDCPTTRQVVEAGLVQLRAAYNAKEIELAPFSGYRC